MSNTINNTIANNLLNNLLNLITNDIIMQNEGFNKSDNIYKKVYIRLAIASHHNKHLLNNVQYNKLLNISNKLLINGK